MSTILGPLAVLLTWAQWQLEGAESRLRSAVTARMTRINRIGARA